jgi:hypothetical protein
MLECRCHGWMLMCLLWLQRKQLAVCLQVMTAESSDAQREEASGIGLVSVLLLRFIMKELCLQHSYTSFS